MKIKTESWCQFVLFNQLFFFLFQSPWNFILLLNSRHHEFQYTWMQVKEMPSNSSGVCVTLYHQQFYKKLLFCIARCLLALPWCVQKFINPAVLKTSLNQDHWSLLSNHNLTSNKTKGRQLLQLHNYNHNLPLGPNVCLGPQQIHNRSTILCAFSFYQMTRV